MKQILVIEDEKAVLENIIEIITEYDFQVIGAKNGSVGIDLAIKNLPDLIICDVMMPELDGFGVFNQLQKFPDTSTIPFIFLTAKADKEDMRQGMELGADDYLTKPFTPVQLYKAIETRLAKQDKIKKKSVKEMEELRVNLASTLPHEFRTPLNGILASSQFLIEYFDTLEHGEIKQLHENIYTSAQRLHRLILNYLYYTELELLKNEFVENKDLSDFRTYSPAELLKVLCHKKALKSERENDLFIDAKANCQISISEDHFIKICDELTDNAFKFSESGTNVSIVTEIDKGFFYLTFIDHGRGMTASQISKIGAYVQFDRRTYEQQGSGLGLVIVKRLIDIYNGNISIDSEPEEYTNIRVGFPIADESI